MSLRIMSCIFGIGLALTANSQTIDIRGKVSNQAGSPIAGAIVTLAGRGMKDTTESDGEYSLSTKTSSRKTLARLTRLWCIVINNRYKNGC